MAATGPQSVAAAAPGVDGSSAAPDTRKSGCAVNEFSRRQVGRDSGLGDVLWEDGERRFRRAVRASAGSIGHSSIAVQLVAEHPDARSLERLAHEYELREHLDTTWALRPLDLVRDGGGRAMLVLEHHEGVPLERLAGAPMEIGRFLPLALAVVATVGRAHEAGIIHKDIKPANILVDERNGRAWLTGFGIATRLPRERQSPDPPEVIAGTLSHMAPEQTGRMNRSLDSRADLYALGVTLYQLLTGALPFKASDPIEWVHSHIARKALPPSAIRADVPAALASIVMKLLAKTAEQRYQTALGVEHDLRRCLDEWRARRRIEYFLPGDHDVSDRLLIPERLYGRDREVAVLLAAFDRIVAGNRPGLVLVSGYSGIGKSALVAELHPSLVPPRGLFASGKFDQYKRDIPYATLAQALRGLVRPLLGKTAGELQPWRDAMRDALGPNGRLLLELVPELRHVIGEQPEVADLPPREAQGRFQLVFRRFITVFARPEHPLALFLDDLQWLDAATLDLLEDLLTCDDVQHLLLVGAYRDNEVHSTHPLALRIEALRQKGVILDELVLAPLAREDIRRLLGDAVHCDTERAAPLARLIHQHTSGNPFFAIQFMTNLAEEGLLRFDHAQAQWTWDIERIESRGFTDNVADLMVRKLDRMPAGTREALQQLACMGSGAGFDDLQTILECSAQELHARLWEATRSGALLRAKETYRFLHDRVQEAAYSLIPVAERAAAHLRIGTLLADNLSQERLEQEIFEIVNHLNIGADLIVSTAARERAAELNLIAGRRARLSTAFASALNFLRQGRAFLSDATWETRHDLIFAIELLTAECELLTARMTAAEARLEMLSERATTRHHAAVTTRLRLTLHTGMGRGDLGVEVFLAYLAGCGIHWSAHPDHEDALREYERIWTLLGKRRIEELVDLPLLDDPDVEDMLDVFSEIVTPAFFFDEQLSTLILCRMVTLSLEHGNCDASCFGYVFFATLAGPRFGNYPGAFEFGRLGYELVEKRGLTRYQARTYISFGNMIVPWTRHAASGRELIRRAFDTAWRMGDLTFAAYSWHALVTNCLLAGDALEQMQADATRGVDFATSMGFDLGVDLCSVQLALIRNLRGLTPTFGSLDGEDFDETDTERHYGANPALALAEFFYMTRKLQARYLAADYVAAVAAAGRAGELVWTAPSQLETADYFLFAALAHAAAWRDAPPDERRRHALELARCRAQLEVWAEHCPVNFECRAALLGAETARIEDRPFDAEMQYERAICSAAENNVTHVEAIACELAAGFHAARGLHRTSRAFLRDAREAYGRWDAEGKLRQLDRLHPRSAAAGPGLDETTTMVAANQLDLATVIEVSQAISGEIVMEKLIDTLMRKAVEHGGAERGLLVMAHEDDFHVEAEATVRDGELIVSQGRAPLSFDDMPSTVLQYVIRTREAVLLHDASREPTFADDACIRTRNVRSVLCMPLLKQGRLVGLLYLENSLAPNVFGPACVTILKLLASEAATSLENTRLYHELQEREGRVRRLVDSDIVGINIWHADGRVLETNDAFLRIVGYEREDFLSGRVRWGDLTPPEWREHDARALAQQLAGVKAFAAHEREYIRKDGTRVPVLAGGTIFDDQVDEGVAFVVDLTELKRAERALHESEREARLIVDTIPGLVAILTPEGQIEAVNKRLVEYCGQPLDDMKRWLVNGTVHVEDVARVAVLSANAIASGDLHDYEARIRRFDGVYRWQQIRGLPLRDSEGHIAHWYVLLSDIDDRKRAEAESRGAEEALNRLRSELAHVTRVASLGALTASIAHEINQPLAGILTNSSTCLRLLDAVPPDIPTARETARRTIRDANRASDVTARLRALFSKKATAFEHLDLNDAAREVVALSITELQSSRILLEQEFASGLPLVTGDRIQLQQVVLNLLRNAAEAMLEVHDRPRRLLLRTLRDGEWVRMDVRDSGTGIEAGNENKVFDAFYTTKSDGMGIGLSVCRSIIERHGGRIQATRNEDAGMTFSFSIPCGE